MCGMEATQLQLGHLGFLSKHNQPIDLTQNQITCCIVYHHQIVGPKILALHISTQKRAYSLLQIQWHNYHEETH